ncbi:MAG: ParB/RepB/Spo0J family partition protein [Actinomycetota bacterium]|nr:ParB/RepB/Spo0J family partition protein [Actinomycetota bacterium]
MVRPQGGLGRGIGALIPPPDPRSKSMAGASPRPDSTAQRAEPSGYIEIPLEAIVVNQLQPRKVFEDEALKVLADSIQRFGVLQPVVVRPSDGDKPYELIAGERRWRASELAGKRTVPAIVRNSNEESSLVEALVENLHRQDLNPLEEAAAFRQLLDDFGVTHSELGDRLGKGRATISNSIRLLELPADAQAAIAERKITAGHARALLACTSLTQQTDLLNKILDGNISVRQAEMIAREESTSGSVSTSRAKPQNSMPKASVLEAQKRLSDYLNTTVSVQLNAKRGKIVIDFATIDDLQRIYDLIYPNQDTN